MQPYTYIRFAEGLTLHAPDVIFEREADSVIVSLKGDRKGRDWKLEGETATAASAFLDGSLTFPVNENGVLDIVRGWQEKVRAHEVGQVGRVVMDPFTIPTVDQVLFNQDEPKRVRPSGASTGGTPRPDYDKLQKRLGVKL